jgi:hypothetical protein
MMTVASIQQIKSNKPLRRVLFDSGSDVTIIDSNVLPSDVKPDRVHTRLNT